MGYNTGFNPSIFLAFNKLLTFALPKIGVMRIVLVQVLISCQLILPSKAQDSVNLKPKRSANYFVFQVGLTNAEMYGKDLDLQLSKPGSYYETNNAISASLEFKREFTHGFYAKMGVGYIQKNGYVRNTTFTYPINNELKFITVPLVLGIQPINFKNTRNVQISFESGFSYNSNQGSIDQLERGLHPDNTVFRNQSMFSFVVGANFEIKVSEKIGVILNYRFQRDLAYYFLRRYKWEVFNWPEPPKTEYYDYDVWVNSNSFSLGVFTKL